MSILENFVGIHGLIIEWSVTTVHGSIKTIVSGQTVAIELGTSFDVPQSPSTTKQNGRGN